MTGTTMTVVSFLCTAKYLPRNKIPRNPNDSLARRRTDACFSSQLTQDLRKNRRGPVATPPRATCMWRAGDVHLAARQGEELPGLAAVLRGIADTSVTFPRSVKAVPSARDSPGRRSDSSSRTEERNPEDPETGVNCATLRLTPVDSESRGSFGEM